MCFVGQNKNRHGRTRVAKHTKPRFRPKILAKVREADHEVIESLDNESEDKIQPDEDTLSLFGGPEFNENE